MHKLRFIFLITDILIMEENVEGNGALIEGFEQIVIEIRRALEKGRYEALTKKTAHDKYILRG